jgi:hypothetical protein
MSDNSNIDISFIEKANEIELTNWLLKGFCTNNFFPIEVHEEPSAEIQLDRIFRILSIESKEKFKSSVSRALTEWRSKSYPSAALCALSQAISIIGSKIESGELDYLKDSKNKSDEDSYLDTLEILIAAIRGYSPHQEVFVFFKRLFYREDIDHRLAAQLFLGLCECDPEQYFMHVSRFFHLYSLNPEYFQMQYIFFELERIVTLKTLMEGLAKVSFHVQEKFIEFLCGRDESPVELFLKYDSGIYAMSRSSEFPSHVPFTLDFIDGYKIIQRREISRENDLIEYVRKIISRF